MPNESISSSHLTSSAKWMLSSPKDAKISKINTDIWIDYPVADRIFTVIGNMLKTPRGIQSPCLLVAGNSGSGKSSIFNQVKKRQKSERHQALVFISLGDNPTNQAIKGEISKALGFPPDLSFSRSGDLPPELFHAIRQRGIRGLVVDELNNSLLVSRSEQRKNMAFLKGLGNKDNGLCVFGFGTPEAYNAIAGDQQLARRFYKIEIPAWNESEEFRSFLYALESTIPLRKPSKIYDLEKSRYILRKTDGLMDEIVKLVRSAACYAISQDFEEITMDMLELAALDPWGYGARESD